MSAIFNEGISEGRSQEEELNQQAKIEEGKGISEAVLNQALAQTIEGIESLEEGEFSKLLDRASLILKKFKEPFSALSIALASKLPMDNERIVKLIEKVKSSLKQEKITGKTLYSLVLILILSGCSVPFINSLFTGKEVEASSKNNTATPTTEVSPTIQPTKTTTPNPTITAEGPVIVEESNPNPEAEPKQEVDVIKEEEKLEEMELVGDFDNYFNIIDANQNGLDGPDKIQVKKEIPFLNYEGKGNGIFLDPNFWATEWTKKDEVLVAMPASISYLKNMQNGDALFQADTEGIDILFESGTKDSSPIIDLISNIPVKNRNTEYRESSYNLENFAKNQNNLEDTFISVVFDNHHQGVSVSPTEAKEAANYALHLASRVGNSSEVDEEKMKKIKLRVVAAGLVIEDQEMIQRYFDNELTDEDISVLQAPFTVEEWNKYINAELSIEEVTAIQARDMKEDKVSAQAESKNSDPFMQELEEMFNEFENEGKVG